jgi:hypothetical protein
MTADEQSGPRAPVPDSTIPQALWVRHRGVVHQVPICPDTHPYTTVALMRGMSGSNADRPGVSRVVSMVDGSQLTVSGTGQSEQDPMFCAELEDEPLPECRCDQYAAARMSDAESW